MRIAALSSHIPERRVATEAIVRSATGSVAEAKVFERIFGLSSVAVAEPGLTLCDHFAPVIEALRQRHDGTAPDTLIHVRGQPLNAPQARLSLEKLRADHSLLSGIVHCYEVDQYNCSGLFWALDLARVLIETRVARCIVVLAGDSHAGLNLADRYLPGCTLMGDAFCGLVLDDQPHGLRVGTLALHSHPQFSFGHAGNVDQMGSFFAAHSGIVSAVLGEIGFDWGGSAPLLPHNVNRFAWQTFARETSVDPDRIRLGLLPGIGHCYTCDPFLLLDAELRAAGPCKMTEPLTLLSVGMGGFVGACQVAHDTAPVRPVSSPTAYRKECFA